MTSLEILGSSLEVLDYVLHMNAALIPGQILIHIVFKCSKVL